MKAVNIDENKQAVFISHRIENGRMFNAIDSFLKTMPVTCPVSVVDIGASVFPG